MLDFGFSNPLPQQHQPRHRILPAPDDGVLLEVPPYFRRRFERESRQQKVRFPRPFAVCVLADAGRTCRFLRCMVGLSFPLRSRLSLACIKAHRLAQQMSYHPA
jgi:hypothetical protein